MTHTLDVDRFREGLQGVYADLDAEVARLAPVCEISGKCCRFEEYGHTLFVSAPEIALLLEDGPTRMLNYAVAVATGTVTVRRGFFARTAS